mmetsp:Transcript_2000/g.3228  ORF Transcript_2000/g.3228 Transcript_2000/m.3228 type:complete len:296 (-) Transcript_2000:208-1095(-)
MLVVVVVTLITVHGIAGLLWFVGGQHTHITQKVAHLIGHSTSSSSSSLSCEQKSSSSQSRLQRHLNLSMNVEFIASNGLRHSEGESQHISRRIRCIWMSVTIQQRKSIGFHSVAVRSRPNMKFIRILVTQRHAVSRRTETASRCRASINGIWFHQWVKCADPHIEQSSVKHIVSVRRKSRLNLNIDDIFANLVQLVIASSHTVRRIHIEIHLRHKLHFVQQRIALFISPRQRRRQLHFLGNIRVLRQPGLAICHQVASDIANGSTLRHKLQCVVTAEINVLLGSVAAITRRRYLP